MACCTTIQPADVLHVAFLFVQRAGFLKAVNQVRPRKGRGGKDAQLVSQTPAGRAFSNFCASMLASVRDEEDFNLGPV